MVRKVICDILILVCLIALIFAGLQIYQYWKDSQKSEEIFEELRDDPKDDISKAWKENHDTVGWIKIPKTKVDYPVMQNKKEPQFYLHKDFNKKESLRGCLFVDAKTDLKVSKNILIYGHHMLDGTMFGDLVKYSDPSYFKSHKKIKYTFIDEHGRKEHRKYRVIAMFKSVTTDQDSFLDYANIEDSETYEKYMNLIRTKSEVNFDEPVYPTELLTLSTCSYHLPRWAENFHKGRFCVIAVRTK